MTAVRVLLVPALVPLALVLQRGASAQHTVHSFDKQQLSDQFFCEGASFGDFDGDGNPDIVSGPYWYAGPDFEQRHEIYAPKPFDPAGYSDNFFAFPYDFDGDGWLDVLFVGFPGKDASWFRNPGPAEDGSWTHWQRNVVFDVVDNESPTFTDLTGDGRPELVCQFEDRLGYALVDWDDPAAKWQWHPVSAQGIGGRFTHGLGVGDLDGDGRQDVLWKHGWWQQPESLEGDPQWQHHPVKFSGRGGAQMLVFDVDGDGDNDVVSSDNAHGFGLYWHEADRQDGEVTFTSHKIMGARPDENAYGVVIGNLHALCAADVNGDGLTDVITGNRYWAHGGRDAADNVEPKISWFQLRHVDGVVRWGVHEIDGNSGVGTQVVAGDIDGDGAVDVVVGNKMGTFVHRHRVRSVSRSERTRIERAELRSLVGDQGPVRVGVLPKNAEGRELNLDFETGDLRDWTADGEAFAKVVEGDTVIARRSDMRSGHAGRFWVGGYEHAESDQPQGTLTSAPFVLDKPFAVFLVGGGGNASTRVEIVAVDGGDIVYTTSGKDDEHMHQVSVDLREHLGEQLFVRLVDEATGHWGHLNFDDFRLCDEDQRDGYFTAEDAAARMRVPPGFHVDVFASEPDVHQPIAMAIDASGRLWVAEAYSYPTRRPDGEGTDRILVFEDPDGDGEYDRRTVFQEGLNLVSGLEVGHGGVFVGAAPFLYFIPDADRDLVPDGEPEVLLDGWHYEDTHETLNAFTWGPDGWLYGCHGVFTHSLVGRPGTPDDERIPLNAAVWRYHPKSRDFEVFAHGTSNPWGIDFDAHGQAFITACVIPHLYHVIQGGIYRRQSGRHFQSHCYDDIKTIADHVHYIGRNAHDGNNVSDSVGGGHAHCGAMIYRGGRWPEEYVGGVFMENLHGHRINKDVLRRAGSGFVASHGEDLLVSNDSWFMAVAMDYGPDGNVYMIDWYDDQTCHHREVEKWDRTNGRIYKICYGDEQVAAVDLHQLDDAALAEQVFADNEFYARRARRLLAERNATAVAAGLEAKLADRALSESKRLSAMWALHGIGALDDARLLELLDDEGEYVRAFAVQFAVEDRAATEQQLSRFAQMAADDPSPVVRLYLASALQRLSNEQRWSIAEALVRHAEDAEDHNLPLMVWYGIEPAVCDDPARALALARTSRLPRILEFTVRRLTEAGGAAVAAVVDTIAASDDAATAVAVLAPMQVALERVGDAEMPTGWPAAYAHIAAFDDVRARDEAVWVGALFGDTSVRPGLLRLAADTDAPGDRRERAFELLAAGDDPVTARLVLDLVDDPLLGERAVRALANFDEPSVPAFLLERWGDLDTQRRAAAVATMSGRPAWATQMLKAVAAGTVDRSALDAPTRLKLTQLGDASLEQLLTEVWGRSVQPSAAIQQQLETWKGKLTEERLSQADLHNGRAVFARTCMVCHQLFGSGSEFAPDLTGSNRRDLDYILTNILDPNAEVSRENMMSTVRLKSGNIVMGLIADETETSVTVRTQVTEQVVAKKDIDGVERLEMSMMPPGQLDGLTDDEARDLIAYLAADAQVPMRANALTQSLFFDGQSLAMWDADPELWRVESGEIVGSTATGISRNDFLISNLLVGDFELTFEVRLVGDRGNSGVQFRSEALPGRNMKGLQADIGAGWWGKLYDEHGRGLLVDEDHAGKVEKDGWNRYRIVAEGTRIRTWINDHPCVDFEDAKGPREGVIGLQLHSGGPTEVRFRNLSLTVR